MGHTSVDAPYWNSPSWSCFHHQASCVRALLQQGLPPRQAHASPGGELVRGVTRGHAQCGHCAAAVSMRRPSSTISTGARQRHWPLNWRGCRGGGVFHRTLSPTSSSSRAIRSVPLLRAAEHCNYLRAASQRDAVRRPQPLRYGLAQIGVTCRSALRAACVSCWPGPGQPVPQRKRKSGTSGAP